VGSHLREGFEIRVPGKIVLAPLYRIVVLR